MEWAGGGGEPGSAGYHAARACSMGVTGQTPQDLGVTPLLVLQDALTLHHRASVPATKIVSASPAGMEIEHGRFRTHRLEGHLLNSLLLPPEYNHSVSRVLQIERSAVRKSRSGSCRQSLPAFLPFLLRLRGALRLLGRAFARTSARLFLHLSHLQPRRVMTFIR